MSNKLTLVFSRHKEDGNCTANTLLQIIAQVKPDVIFEELSEKLYKEAYTLESLNNLETLAIRAYTSKNEVLHIPVDTFDRPENYDREQDALNKALTSEAGYESAQLRGFLDDMENVIYKYGFDYLNDNANDINLSRLQDLRLAALKKLDNTKLNNIYNKVQEVIIKREDVMLDNVYRYAAEKFFSNGLMFIGSGHRESMMKKIKERVSVDRIIHWQYLSDLK